MESFVALRTKFNRKEDCIKFRNIEYLPAFYLIPKEILMKCGKEMFGVPRNPHQLMNDKEAIALVESDLFRRTVEKSLAMMAWKHIFDEKTKIDMFSDNDPAVIFTRNAKVWIGRLEDEGILPLYWDLFGEDNDYDLGFVDSEFADAAIEYIVPGVLRRYKFWEWYGVIKEHRCFEDFSYKQSDDKREFRRHWYHIHTLHPQVSLESIVDEYTERNNGAELGLPDYIDIELNLVEDEFVHKFINTLEEVDKQILELRRRGKTLEEIAERLGYKTHSAISKRLRKVGLAYEDFFEEELGFRDKYILRR